MTDRRFVARCGMVALVALFVGLSNCQVARAELVGPDDTFFAKLETGPTGANLLDSLSVPLVALTFSGTLHSEVYDNDLDNPFGLDKLTFVYWIDNVGPNSISRFTVSNFSGFETDMSYADGPGQIPTTVDRSAGIADVVGFSYLSGALGPGRIAAGSSSVRMVVQTDATDYAVTLASVINGSTAMAQSFAPTQIVPEPSTLGLAGLGMVGSLAFAWRRRRARK